MAERVCHWWVGYLLVSPVRRWFEKPEEVLGPHLKSGATAATPISSPAIINWNAHFTSAAPVLSRATQPGSLNSSKSPRRLCRIDTPHSGHRAAMPSPRRL